MGAKIFILPHDISPYQVLTLLTETLILGARPRLLSPSLSPQMFLAPSP